MFKEPKSSDWAWWTGVVLGIGGFVAPLAGGLTVLDAAFGGAINFAVFGLVPAAIRNAVKRRRGDDVRDGGSASGPAPGWYDNPEGHGRRYWNGDEWTQHTDGASAPE